MARGTAVAVALCALLLSACADFTPAKDRSGRARATAEGMLSCDIVLAVADGARPASGLDRQIASQIARVRATPLPSAELDRLGWLFVAKARRTHQPSSFMLAARTARCMHDVSADTASALLLEGHALYNLHRFAKAEAIARRLVTLRTAPFDYGLLGDSLFGQGHIEEAATAYQRMVDLKPGLHSYSRAAQIRWITGDLDGARELMTMAARAGSVRNPETLAWTLAELARFELAAGDLDAARTVITQALEVFPDHAPSLLLRGRVDLAAGQPDAAVPSLRAAVRVNPSAETMWALADALMESGDVTGAEDVETRLRERGPIEDPRTTALYLATRRLHPDLALSLARREIEVRSDPHTQDALGWALAATGDIETAGRHLQKALAHGTIDPRLFLHAGVVATAAGRPAEAARWLELAQRYRVALLPSEQRWLDDPELLADSNTPGSYGSASHNEELT